MLQFALQLEYVDHLLGAVLDTLEASGRLGDTLLVVVADHGLAIVPGKNLRYPDQTTLADIMRVPLFIKYPGQTVGSRDHRRVKTIDILPTIAEVLGLPPVAGVDGKSLVAAEWPSRPNQVFNIHGRELELETVMDMQRAIDRYAREIQQDSSALNSMGIGGGQQFFGSAPTQWKPNPRLEELRLDRPEWYQTVDLGSGFLPTRLTGKVEGVVPGSQILISLNGVIAGNSRTQAESGRVSILLDPRHFRNGANEIKAY